MHARLSFWRFKAMILTITTSVGAGGAMSAQADPPAATYFLPSNSQTVYRGYFPRNAAPALTVPDGATVRIDTLSHQGQNCLQTCTPGPGDFSIATCTPSGDLDPIAFQASQGVPASEVLPDATEIFYHLDYARRTKSCSHVLTGPIYVQGAQPGDTLEVRVVDVAARVPWGYNTQGPGGALPGYLTQSTRKLIRIQGNVALFNNDIQIALKPFQGIMAVAPANNYLSPIPAEASLNYVGSRPPGPMGGNMDLNDLGVGTSVYFPVFQTGAQFFTGDPHEVQGNGEVSGTALEQSNTVTLQFIVHKNGGLTGPRAETPRHYIFMGIATDHDAAVQLALKDALDFLQAEKGLSPADAMAFASLAVDLDIAESVDFTVLVMARVPKLFFKGMQPAFWHKPILIRNEIQRQGLEPIPAAGANDKTKTKFQQWSAHRRARDRAYQCCLPPSPYHGPEGSASSLNTPSGIRGSELPSGQPNSPPSPPAPAANNVHRDRLHSLSEWRFSEQQIKDKRTGKTHKAQQFFACAQTAGRVGTGISFCVA